MDQLLLDLLVRLETVGDRDESLYDTVVREKMGLAVFSGFIKPKPGYGLPDDYGMSGEDDRVIKAALREYIDGATALAPTLGLTTFHRRLAAFQNKDVRTPGQGTIPPTSSAGRTPTCTTPPGTSSARDNLPAGVQRALRIAVPTAGHRA